MAPYLTALLNLGLILAIGLHPAMSCASAPSAQVQPVQAETAITRNAPRPIGAIRSTGTHLVRPRPEVLTRSLRARRAITPGMSARQIRTVTSAAYQEFARQSRVWVAPEIQLRALGLHSEPATPVGVSADDASRQSLPVQPVTAKILVLAVDFGGSDTFTYYGRDGDRCASLTVTTSGPRKGEIPYPGARDNNTVWYDPAQTANASFYGNLIFGYEGIGRVRPDLEDPYDHQPGINLAGYSVQDYFDHMAGVGNVVLQGSAEGWVTVSHSEGYYGAPGCSSGKHDEAGPGTRAQLVVEALAKFQEEHPEYYGDSSPDAFWKQFDANRDGVVDSLWIIHAGMGQEAGGGAQGEFALWSHSSDLRSTSSWKTGYPVHQGDNRTRIVVGPYTLLPENADLGVLVEEFGHNCFGLPDLYTTDIENSIGFWSVMAAGTWGGWLGGATPVGMPLWFRLIAQCGDQPCNWHAPLRSLSYHATPQTVTIGQLESTPEGSYKGIKINLPDIVDKGPTNRAGTGKGAYTGSGVDNLDISLERTMALSVHARRLSFNSCWDLEEDRDYGYVMLKVGGKDWVYLQDVDGIMRTTNPHGANLAYGLTGTGKQKLTFDVAPYRGRKVTLRLRYKTDALTTGAGWWVDDLSLNGRVRTRFETAVPPATFPGAWRNSSPGWQVVPTSSSYRHYYLVEWRTATKYDRMVRTAYAKNLDEEHEWQVERVPYNIPGALLYYCNTRYHGSYSLAAGLTDAPSIGPKYPLLLIDMNYGPMPLDDNGTTLDSRIASYDAALTLQAAEPFTITQIVKDGAVLQGPWTFAAKPPVTGFDDALGYYSGFFAGPPCREKYCYANRGGSAVIPAMGKYTTRITHYDGTPYPELYGKRYLGSYLGTGNPGDDGLQWGVRLELISKSPDHQHATLRLNASGAAP